jgi:hypothetical protein
LVLTECLAGYNREAEQVLMTGDLINPDSILPEPVPVKGGVFDRIPNGITYPLIDEGIQIGSWEGLQMFIEWEVGRLTRYKFPSVVSDRPSKSGGNPVTAPGLVE